MSTFTFSDSDTVTTSLEGFLSIFANILNVGTSVSRTSGECIITDGSTTATISGANFNYEFVNGEMDMLFGIIDQIVLTLSDGTVLGKISDLAQDAGVLWSGLFDDATKGVSHSALEMLFLNRVWTFVEPNGAEIFTVAGEEDFVSDATLLTTKLSIAANLDARDYTADDFASGVRENVTGLRHCGREMGMSDVVEQNLGDAAVALVDSAELSLSKTRPIVVQILPSPILTTISNSRLSKPSRT